jgi:hypothetical protein
MPSRDIKDLELDFQPVIVAFEQRLIEEGLSWFKRCCTYRSQEEQNALWMRGRASLDEVNRAYKACGLAPITAVENKRPVTWTAVSNHTSRCAVDYYIEKNGRYVSDIKVDYDEDDIPDWDEFGQIAQECGLEWGGTWLKKDLPHVQRRA